MKKVFLATAVLLTAGAAHATYCKDGTLIASHPNGDCSKPIPAPKPTPVPTGSSGSTSGASSNQTQNAAAAATSSAAAAAKAASLSNANATSGSRATGGTASVGNVAGTGTGGSNSLGSVGNDSSQSNYKSLSLGLVLPPPAWTQPLPMSECKYANTAQESNSYGPAYSNAKGGTNTDNCAIADLINSFWMQCRFESASSMQDSFGEKLLPNWKHGKYRRREELVDMTPNECEVFHERIAGGPAPEAVSKVTGVVYQGVSSLPPVVAPAAVASKASCEKPKAKPSSKRKGFWFGCRWRKN